MTWDQVQAISGDSYMESEHLTDREKAAVLWAEHVTRNTARSRDDVFQTVAAHFDETELVELTLIAAFFNMFNRITDSLRIDIEVQTDIDKIKTSVDLDPGKLRTYLQALLDNWPEEFPEVRTSCD